MRKLLAVVVAGAALGAGAAAPSAAEAPPTRIQAGAREFQLVLSRLQVRSGPAIVELVNYGEDDHDLKLRRIGGSRTLSLPVTRPGERSQLRTRLAAGRYRVWCSLPGHREHGMRAELRVRRTS